MALSVNEVISKKPGGVIEFGDVGELTQAEAAALTIPATPLEVEHTVGYQVAVGPDGNILARTFDPVTNRYSDFVFIGPNALVSSVVIKPAD